MILLDEVVSVDEETAICRTHITRGGILEPFLDSQGNLPGWYALELMAQTIGVWSGWHRAKQGQKMISLGMVLGARELICAAGCLPKGKTVSIAIKLLMRDERFGSFECEISAEETLATGRINTFQPNNEELNTLFQLGASA